MSPVSPAVLSESIDESAGVAGQAPVAVSTDRAGSGSALSAPEVAAWLESNPQFFEDHAELLSEIRVRHPQVGPAQGNRTVSLVERQVLVLREKNEVLAGQMTELIRIGQANDSTNERLQQLTRDLLRESDPLNLPARLSAGLADIFSVPQVAIRLFGVAGLAEPYGDDVSADLRRRVNEMTAPYCGPNSMAEPAGWLPAGGDETASVALMALRTDSRADCFGLLVLGSPDAGRFQAGMATDFLERLAGLASASLSRLLSGTTTSD